MLPLETNLPVRPSTLSHHRSTIQSSEPASTLSWILSITLPNKKTDKLIQLTDLLAHTVSSSSTPPALVEATALSITDGTINNTLLFQSTETISLSHTSPSLSSMRRSPTSGLNSQLVLVNKMRSILPRTSLTLLSPPARRTQPILQTQKLTKPVLLLTA